MADLQDGVASVRLNVPAIHVFLAVRLQRCGCRAHHFRQGFDEATRSRPLLAMQAPGASTSIFGTDCPCQMLPVRVERYCEFIQASDKLDGLK